MSLSHKQAQNYIHAAVDGRLSAKALEELHDHLEHCPACQEYADRLTELETRLFQSLQARWPSASQNQPEIHRTIARAQSRLEKRDRVRQVYGTVQAVAWAGLVVALVIAVAWIFKTVAPQPATAPGESPTLTTPPTLTLVPAPTTSATPEALVEKITPTAQVETENKLTVCMGSEPDTLYLYGGAMLAASHVLEAIYDGPIDNNSFSYQPVILEKLPSLSDGDAVTKTVTVGTGDTVVDDSGGPVTLKEGILVRPAGCYSAGCAVEFDGTPLEMEQLVVTFTLKAGIRWSDGEPLTAHDSVYSFELDKDPDTPTDKSLTDRTARYEALDDHSTVWTGLPGYRDATYFTNFWSPLPAHAWGELAALELTSSPESTRKPLGWGAFIIQEWILGDHITLVKNEHYWRAGEGWPKFDTLVYRFVGENPSTTIAALLAGECDIADQTAHLDAQGELLLELQAAGKLNATFVTGTVWEHADFCITPAESYERPDFFGDVRVRRAVAYCMDRQAIVDSVMYGQSQVLDTYLPPHHPLYDPDARQYRFDPQAGAMLLDRVGWLDDDGDPETPRVAQGMPGVPDGTPLTFDYWTTSANQRQAVTQILKSSLAQCGIQINVEYWSPGEFFADGPDGPLFGRHFDMGQFAWLTDVEPPCELYLGSEIPGEENNWSGSNNTGFNNPEYNAACNAARQSLPGTPEHRQYHKEAQRIFAEQLPALPLYLRFKLAAIRPDLQGFIMDPTAHSEFWNIEEFELGEP